MIKLCCYKGKVLSIKVRELALLSSIYCQAKGLITQYDLIMTKTELFDICSVEKKKHPSLFGFLLSSFHAGV